MIINTKIIQDFAFFPATVRAYISDFAVITAIVLMVLVDIAFGINTPKLVVPDKFSPTWSGEKNKREIIGFYQIITLALYRLG